MRVFACSGFKKIQLQFFCKTSGCEDVRIRKLNYICRRECAKHALFIYQLKVTQMGMY